MSPNLYLSGTRKYLLEEACLGTPWKRGKSDLVYFFLLPLLLASLLVFFRDAAPDSTTHTSAHPSIIHYVRATHNGIGPRRPGHGSLAGRMYGREVG